MGLHTISTCDVEVLSGEVYAAETLTLKCKVACSEGCDLRGQSLRIVNDSGVVIDRVELTALNGQAYETDECVVNAPVDAGTYTWTTVFPAHEQEGVSHGKTTSSF